MPSAIEACASEIPNGLPSEQNISNGHDVSGTYDLICIGFGPASLAVAVALEDLAISARVLFVERQPCFAWHTGMLLPDARMQISFLKDLATFRDPRSHFTFLNYLKCKGRLEAFANLSTFLPLREEFNDYLTWVATHFAHQVSYATEAISVEPLSSNAGQIDSWRVVTRDLRKLRLEFIVARHVVIAIGGEPKIPPCLQPFGGKVVHSSQYLAAMPNLIPGHKQSPRLAVLGGGQSAAEIFDNLTSRYSDAYVTLYTAGTALKPSDDSPFVNEIFNPSVTTTHFSLSPAARHSLIQSNRATNYSVVRPHLLEHLYQKLYRQRLHYADEDTWPHRIAPNHHLNAASLSQSDPSTLTLHFTNPLTGVPSVAEDIDLVITATGYTRSAHEKLLKPIEDLAADGLSSVERNYRLKMRPEAVSADCGIWLQGCCEESHGLGDSLLSVLAVRGGELVESIFGPQDGDGEKGQMLGPASARKAREEEKLSGGLATKLETTTGAERGTL